MTSRIELLIRQYLAYFFPDENVIHNRRPDFLRNVHTRKNLELDIWYPNLRFAVEVNGWPHKKRERAKDHGIVWRDQTKNAWCAREQVRLFTVMSKDGFLCLRTKIRRHLEEHGCTTFSERLCQKPPLHGRIASLLSRYDSF